MIKKVLLTREELIQLVGKTFNIPTDDAYIYGMGTGRDTLEFSFSIPLEHNLTKTTWTKEDYKRADEV